MHRTDAGRLAREILDTSSQLSRRPGTAEPLACKLLERLTGEARRFGVALEHYVVGPWHVGEASPRGVSRFIGLALPTVERGGFALAVATLAEAAEIVAFLNWCDVPEPGAI